MMITENLAIRPAGQIEIAAGRYRGSDQVDLVWSASPAYFRVTLSTEETEWLVEKLAKVLASLGVEE